MQILVIQVKVKLHDVKVRSQHLYASFHGSAEMHQGADAAVNDRSHDSAARQEAEARVDGLQDALGLATAEISRLKQARLSKSQFEEKLTMSYVSLCI